MASNQESSAGQVKVTSENFGLLRNSEENIQRFSNEQLGKLLAQSNLLYGAAVKQYELNLDSEETRRENEAN